MSFFKLLQISKNFSKIFIEKNPRIKWTHAVGSRIVQGSTAYIKKLLKGLHHISIQYSVHKRTVKIVHLELSLNTIIEQYRLS